MFSAADSVCAVAAAVFGPVGRVSCSAVFSVSFPGHVHQVRVDGQVRVVAALLVELEK
jgi:hypothetical protein